MTWEEITKELFEEKTTKRFTIDVETENYENAYFEEDKFLCYEDDYDCILQKLNELAEENKTLKKRVDDKEVAVEVETCKLMEKVFALIDKKIDELEERYKLGQEVYKGCPMHNIRFGINNLKELKKELRE